MAESRKASLDAPDQAIEFEKIRVDQVHLGDLTVGRIVLEPGWRWSEHVRPHVGGEWCEARHVGVVLSGRFEVAMRDGSTHQFGPQDVFEIPPSHDGYIIGDEPCVQIEWSGLRTFTATRLMGTPNSTLATLMFTDLVDSTRIARELGAAAWTDQLSTHFESARLSLERHAGREVTTTGDGILATFDGPAAALRCAAEIRRVARDEGLHVRASVHIGEVELVGEDVRGLAVHEAARILGEADADEILVSAITRALAGSSGLEFEPRGPHELKG